MRESEKNFYIMLININTPEFINAKFFMRDEPVICDYPVINPSQVHGREIIILDDNYNINEHSRADGILLKSHKLAASLRFADCAPVLIYPENNNNLSWAMILHSGFKGTCLNICGHALELVNNKNLHAWVGPCIGFNNYMRDFADEWTQKAIKIFDENNYRISGDKVYFNLSGEIYTQLIKSGLASGNINISNIDTFTNPECYSYRRGDINQRMTLLVSLAHSQVR